MTELKEMYKVFNKFSDSTDKMFAPRHQVAEETKCSSCVDLDELEKDYPDEIHHGANLNCGVCDAEYYEEWGSGKRYACNEQAKANHPELKTT